MSSAVATRVTFSRPTALPGSELMQARACAYLWQEVPLGYEVCLISSGGAEWHSGGRAYRSRAGSVCIIPPGELHRALTVAERSDFRVLSLPQPLVQSLGDGAVALGAQQRQLDAPEVSRRLADLLAHLEADDDPLAVEVALVDFVGVAANPDTRRPLALAARRAERMRELMHASYGERLGLGELADAADLTKVQAVRLFTRSFGVTPCQYLMLLRVSHARRLLSAGSDLSTVAYRTGFSDQSHLSRWFKRLYRLAPGAYARGATRGGGPRPLTPQAHRA